MTFEIAAILGKRPYWIKGDQAGSEAEPGVVTRRSLRPVTSTDQICEPRPPCASAANISTRPLGAQVGPSSSPAVGDQPLARAVGVHHADRESAALLLGEGDQVAARRPDRGAVARRRRS